MITTLLLVVAVGLSWSQWLDQRAHEATAQNLTQALAIAAIARVINGVISVAQGTELSVAPVGVGVTLTLGQVLDPLNDLIERFSALALIASVSLATQIVIAEVVVNAWLSAMLTLAVLTYVVLIWAPRSNLQFKRYCAIFLGGLMLLRFIVVATLLLTHWIDTAFLETRQQTAMQKLSATSDQAVAIHQQQSAATNDAGSDASFFDQTTAQVKRFLSASSASIDPQARLEELQLQVEASVAQIINLISIFLLQTLLLPLASAYVAWSVLKWFWTSLIKP